MYNNHETALDIDLKGGIMETIFGKHYELIKTSAEHTPIAVHMLVIGHHFTTASVIAALVMTAYAVSTFCHERAKGGARNE